MQLRGVRPFFSDKYDITQHPNYKYLSDFDKKNAFDVERYLSLIHIFWAIRKVLSSGNTAEVTEQLISMLVRTQSNEEFLIRLKEWLSIWEKEGYKLTQSRY